MEVGGVFRGLVRFSKSVAPECANVDIVGSVGHAGLQFGEGKFEGIRGDRNFGVVGGYVVVGVGVVVQGV